MSAVFGVYDIEVPLGVDWVETLTRKTNNVADDLTGKDCLVQVYASVPVRDAVTGAISPDPILEVTTPGYRGSPSPAWPVVEGISALDSTGVISMTVAEEDVWILSPTNASPTHYWAMVLVDQGDGSITPVVRGRLKVVQAYTVAE